LQTKPEEQSGKSETHDLTEPLKTRDGLEANASESLESKVCALKPKLENDMNRPEVKYEAKAAAALLQSGCHTFYTKELAWSLQ
jgi:hypothetical protein